MPPVTYVLAMFVTYVLASDPPEEPTIFAEWLIIDLPNRLLHYETRRAVVYRVPRLGALIGLAHRIFRSPLLTFGEMPGLSGASPHLCNLRILKLCGS
jgi:hypothetical protein